MKKRVHQTLFGFSLQAEGRRDAGDMYSRPAARYEFRKFKQFVLSIGCTLVLSTPAMATDTEVDVSLDLTDVVNTTFDSTPQAGSDSAGIVQWLDTVEGGVWVNRNTSENQGLIESAKLVESACLTLDGASYIRAADAYNIADYESVAMSFRFCCDTPTSVGTIASWGANYGLRVRVAPDGLIKSFGWDPSQTVISTTQSYADGQWHFLQVTWGDSGMKLMIDEVLRASSTTPLNVHGDPILSIGKSMPVSDHYIGKVCDVKQYGNGELLAHYPLTEGDGNTVYDVSGNGNHGVLRLGDSTLQDAWASTQDDFHYNMEKGFSSSLNLYGQAVVRIPGISRPLDGNLRPTTIECTAFLTKDDISQSLFSVGYEFLRLGIYGSTGTFVFDYQSAPGSVTDISVAPYLNEWHTYKIESDGKYVNRFYIDDELEWSGTALGTSPHTNNYLFIGARGNASVVDQSFERLIGSIASFRYDDGKQVTDLVFAKTDNGILLDRSGAGNGGILTGGSWGTVPALADGSADALGNPISNPAGNWHNGAETKIVQSPYNMALKDVDDGFWYAADGLPIARGYDDFVDVNNTRVFADTSTLGLAKSLRTYSEELSGLDRIAAQKYSDEGAGLTVQPIEKMEYDFSKVFLIAGEEDLRIFVPGIGLKTATYKDLLNHTRHRIFDGFTKAYDH